MSDDHGYNSTIAINFLHLAEEMGNFFKLITDRLPSMQKKSCVTALKIYKDKIRLSHHNQTVSQPGSEVVVLHRLGDVDVAVQDRLHALRVVKPNNPLRALE